MSEPLGHLVESFRFWDVVTQWARERVEAEEVVARALARAIVHDGLRVQSIDPRWVKENDGRFECKGYPYVGFRALPSAPICILRADALEHLLAIVRKADIPSRQILSEEFITKEDFCSWATAQNLRLPHFWFSER